MSHLNQPTLLILLLSIIAQGFAKAADPARVLVIYKTNSVDRDGDGVGDSLQLANYYALKRSVPSANLLGVTVSVSSYYYGASDYAKFQSDIVAPIKNKLSQLGGATNIDILLLAGDLPTVVYNASSNAVSMDNVLMGLYNLNPATNNIFQSGNPYFEPTPSFGADKGHFNHADYKFNNSEMYLVARLGSDDSLRGISQIDQSLYAERFVSATAGSYNGNAYVDSSYGQPDGSKYTDAYLATQPAVQNGDYSSYHSADLNMAYSERFVMASGFPLRWENTTNSLYIGGSGATFSDGSSALRAPRALFYGGWYNYLNYNDVYEWLPGSVACDLNSANYFGLQALKHGASAASYVVNEPFLTGHQRPNILYYYILNGYNFAEASALATPDINWMETNEGDPLYAPNAPKSLIKDIVPPVISTGYPKVTFDNASGATFIQVQVDDQFEPEVVTAKVDFGPTSAYGSVAASAPGYFRTAKILVPFTSGQTYHYRIILTDPVGNVTVSTDYTYTAAGVPDTTPPAAIVNLADSSVTQNSAVLSFTAPGNHGNIGIAASYDIRYSSSPITESSWSGAIQASGEPAPQPAGASQMYTLLNLSPGARYYVAMKTANTAGNISPLSNVVNFRTKTRGK